MKLSILRCELLRGRGGIIGKSVKVRQTLIYSTDTTYKPYDKSRLIILINNFVKEKIKKDRWAEDTMIFVSRDTRAKLKMKALLLTDKGAKKSLTVKELLERYANEK